MGKSRYSEDQIVAILKESEAGTPTNDLVRRHGLAGTLSTTGGRSTVATNASSTSAPPTSSENGVTVA